VPPLAEVKPQLTQVWMMRDLAQRLQTRAAALAERVTKGETLEAVATSIGASVTRAVGLDLAAASQNKALSQDALGKAFTAKPGAVFVAEDPSVGLIVARLEAVHPGAAPMLAQMTEAGRPQMSKTIAREVLEAAAQASRNAVKVKTNAALARSAIGLETETPPAGPAGKAK
jgi:peptidyl-prolyl cis-trans isomerase D